MGLSRLSEVRVQHSRMSLRILHINLATMVLCFVIRIILLDFL